MASKRSKSKAELQKELEFYRRADYQNAWSSILNNLIKWSGLVLIAYFIYRSVDSLSGKATDANIGVSFLAKITLSEWVAWIFGVGGVGYGMRQSNLRKRVVARHEAKERAWEAEIDPNRSSSGLTFRGETHPRDE